MKLYHSLTSPFARKVIMLIDHTSQSDSIELVPAGGTPVNPGTMPLGHNPLGKIPVLARDGASPIYDSRVICRFLDARAGGVLYPDDETLWDVLTVEATADGIMDAAILMTY
jgi:glutathione S-transferase